MARHRGFPPGTPAEPSLMEGRAQPYAETHGLIFLRIFWGHLFLPGLRWADVSSPAQSPSLQRAHETSSFLHELRKSSKALGFLPLTAVPSGAAQLNQASFTPF